MKHPYPPRLADAERSVIGAILLDNRAIERVHATPDDFFDPILRQTFDAMRALAHEHAPIDLVTLEGRLNGQAHGPWMVRLSECISAVPTADNVGAYDRIVIDAGLDRRVRLRLSEISSDPTQEGVELITRATRSLELLRPRDATPIESAETTMRAPSFAIGQVTFPTRFAHLNRLAAGGIKARQLTVIAAPPGGGKTYLACTLAADLQEAIPVLMISTEIDNGEIAARLAGQQRRCTADDILALRVNPGEAADYIAGWNVFVHFLDGAPNALDVIATKMRAIHDRLGVWPAVIVDYLQGLVEDLASGDGIRIAVSHMANALRRMAQDHNVPIVATSTVSRAYYAPKDRPDDPIAYLAAFKESAGIESASALAMYLELARACDLDGWYVGRLAVSKSRRGHLGFVPIRFHGPHGIFEEVSAVEHATGMALIHASEEARILEFVRHAPTPPTRNETAQGIGMRKTDGLAAITRMLDATPPRLALSSGTRPFGAGYKKCEVLIEPDGSGESDGDEP